MPKNPTPAQVEASRRNGARSRGPVTPEGKAAALAQLGNLQHGLLANTLVLPGESQQRFSDLLHQFVLEYAPQTPTEVLMVENLTAAAWRLRRAQAYETIFLAQEGVASAAASAEAFRKAPVRKTARYEAAAFNQFIKTHRDLLRLQLLRHQRPTLELTLDDQPEQVELPSEPEKGPVTHS